MRPSPVRASPIPNLGGRTARSRVHDLISLLDRPRVMQLAMVVVLLIAAWIRFHGLNWDSGKHLHPDERFLSTVTNDLKWPSDFSTYFDPAASTLSPYSLPNMGLYVYGTLPVYIVKWVAVELDRSPAPGEFLHNHFDINANLVNSYDQIVILGRFLSGLFDIGAIVFLFLLGRELYGRKVGLLAAILLSLSVLNIQLSHFYAVDTFANLFVVATMYFLVRASTGGRWLDYALTGLMLGLGLASKLSVLTLAVPILVGTGFDFYRRSLGSENRNLAEPMVIRVLTLLLLAALTFRVVQPIAFAGPSFWDWSLNSRWLRDISEQQKTVSGEADLPWVQQWTGRSTMFPVYNIVAWGLGLPLGLASLAGLGLATFELMRRRKLEHLLLVVYVIVTFVYHAATFVKFMRYFLPIYPFLALFAAYLISWLWERAVSNEKAMAGRDKQTVPGGRMRRVLNRLRLTPRVALGVSALVVGGALLYAAAFSSIYGRTNSRVAASRWMYQNIAPGSTLANEHWDDWLPIGGVDGKTAYGDQGMFESVLMVNYEDDTPGKLEQMVTNLGAADYVVLSSNRLYDSIPRLPTRYPMTIRYYELLFSGQLGFERVAEFTSYPTLFGIQIPDQGAEESFSVYDHPRVQIFRKTPDFSPARVRQLLGQGVSWESVLRVTPRQASAAPNGLRLTSDEQTLYGQTATWSSARISAQSWGSHLPLLAWFIAIQLIGMLALPITMSAFGNFVDRGYVFSKAVGLLLAAWAAWLLASARVAPFTWWTIIAVLFFITVLSSMILARQGWNELLAFAKTRWRLLLLEEGLFWGFFGLSLLIRWNNPDLWHPGLGGEKPMDLAYLTAMVRTPYFPSYDPWFSSGYINYYYFGFVLVATLIHLTSVVPTIAYNLAVPTLFAMTAMGGFAVALNFAGAKNRGGHEEIPSRQGIGRAAILAGLCGALFVAVIGNLGQVQLLWEGVRNLSTLSTTGDTSPFALLAQFADGINQWLGGQKLPLHTDWWYWNATRVIPPGQGEAGPINELPYFTFLFADLHAHMMALPYTLVALGLALNVVLELAQGPVPEAVRASRRRSAELINLALLALVTGALWPMNTWDYPTYIALTAAALVCREFARNRRLDRAGLISAALRSVLIVIAGRLFFLPFHQSYAGAYFGAELWKGSHTPLKSYFIMHGFFLFTLVSYLILEVMRGPGHNGLVRSWRLSLRYIRRRARLQRLRALLTRPAPGERFWITLFRLTLGFNIILFVMNPVVGLAVALTVLTGLVLCSRLPDPRRQFQLCMIGLGLALTAVVEVLVLKGDIGRMNTVFKFYLQVWVLWAVASAAALPALATKLRVHLRRDRIRVPETPEGSTWTPEIAAEVEAWRLRPGDAWARRWWSAFAILLAACLLYPFTATPVRIGDRFENSTSKTLDGAAYMRTSVYADDGRPVVLDWDRQAVEWLRQNVAGIPTIVEANTPLYRWGSRVSIYTGLPTIIGWDWHQKQQRSVIPGQVIDRRIEDVRRIYTSTDLDETMQLLNQYGVRYIYVGPLEQLYYGGDGLNKFGQPNIWWSLVYQNEQVKIYQVH